MPRRSVRRLGVHRCALYPIKDDGATIGTHDASGSGFADPPAHHAGECSAWAPGRVRSYRGAGPAQGGETDCDCHGRERRRVPDIARQVLKVIVNQIEDTQTRIAGLERQVLAWHKSNPVSQRLATIPGIGPIIATAIAATVADPSIFRSGREFAAWLGLVPRQNSTGGKARLGGISKRGDSYLRRLLVNSAHTVLLCSKQAKTDPWLTSLLSRKPRLVVAVALANKTARMAWAIMSRQDTYRHAAVTA